MILQRIASAFRRQDWSQFTIEIMIVMIGIFLGLQVSEWKEEQENRSQEQIYLNRIHGDTLNSIDDVSFMLSNVDWTVPELKTVVKIINGEIQSEALSPLQCHAIYTAHIYASQSSALPTVVELLSTGRLSIIQNEDIKEAVTAYSINLGAWENIKSASATGAYNFSEKYPELIELDFNMTTFPFTIEQRSSVNHLCNLGLMKNNQGFKNNLLDSILRRDNFLNLYIRDQLTQLEKLHVLVDREIGINHTTEIP